MATSFLDDVARRLAEPVSRGRALRLLGAAALAVTVPGLRPKTARATPADCAGVCPAGEAVCQHNLDTCTPYTCCPAPYECCAGPASATCCEPGCTCAPDGRGFMSCQNCPRCSKGFKECGEHACCPKDQNCVLPAGICCRDGHAGCGHRCCGLGQRCANARTGLCVDCAPGREACGKTCCPKGKFCCDEKKGLCCTKKGGGCCNSGTGGVERWICCNAPNRCARLGDVSGFAPAGTPSVCCPPDRVASPKKATSTCCPPGYKSLGGKFLAPAGSSGGLCCRKESTCGKGAGITCCASDKDLGPGLGQVCCRGRCVVPDSFLSDPNNCGTCGKVCTSGKCLNGVCAP